MELNFRPPLLLYHLSGGLQLLIGDNRQSWLLDCHSEYPLLFSTLGGASGILGLYPDLRIIGRTKFSTAVEMEEPISPNFFLSAASQTNQCLAFNQHTFWSSVAHGFNQDGAPENAHICRRLSTQIIKSTRRIERLSLAYRSALPFQKIPEDGSISFEQNKYASHIGNEFGSLLDDLYGLRDAINVIVYRILLRKSGGLTTKALRKAIFETEVSPTTELIIAAMFDGDAGDLIISKMSTYRSVALHSMGTSNPVTLNSTIVKCVRGPLGTVTRIVFPLYDDIAELKEIEAGRSFATPNRDAFLRFSKLDNYLDGLEFCYDCFVRLLKIAESLGTELGVEPRPMIITDRDIIRATFKDGRGNTIHFERDPVSGELIERREDQT